MSDGPTALDLLTRGEIEVKGRLPASSNITLLVECSLDGASTLAVYKPRKGERRLWDFAPGLWKREVAAYLLSEALGWGLVPLTVPRDGPHGEGSLQLFVHADFSQHYFSLLDEPAHHDTLKRICAFDLIANNADRKSGHCLLGPEGRIFAIDNGLILHVDPKLRTVIWDFAGEALPDALLRDLRRLIESELPRPLTELMTRPECEGLRERACALLEAGVFPTDPSGMRYPWPLV
ncbi:MAG TPA: SCO1664 family protein [Methylomirabilota bacterium]|nr:SCO1664 family protein [Methylomirabilota bacterium]